MRKSSRLISFIIAIILVIGIGFNGLVYAEKGGVKLQNDEESKGNGNNPKLDPTQDVIVKVKGLEEGEHTVYVKSPGNKDSEGESVTITVKYEEGKDTFEFNLSKELDFSETKNKGGVYYVQVGDSKSKNFKIKNSEEPEDQENPGTENPGTGDPGTGDPGTGDPGTGNPGTGNPGTENPGTENPVTDNSNTTDRTVEDDNDGDDIEVFLLIPQGVPTTTEVEQVEEVEVDENIPTDAPEVPVIVQTLPKTGSVSPFMFSGIGTILLGLGLFLKKKE